MPAIAIAAVGTAIAAVGTVKTISAQNKMAKAQQQQYAYERQASQNRTTRERRDAIRAARMTGGQLVQSAETQGAGSTSAALGGQGSIVSQLNNNLSFLDTQASLSQRAGDQAGIARTAAASGNNAAAITSLGMAIFNNSGSISNKLKGK